MGGINLNNKATIVLVVEDEELVQELVRLYLENDGFRVVTAGDGREALDKFRSETPDLILLDIMLPTVDGWTVCKEIRKASSTPIIMLTAKGEEMDRVLGLELGADDYIAKPFSPREMVARVKAVLRRTLQEGPPDRSTINYPCVSIEFKARRVTANGQELQMSPKEFDLLWFLAGHHDRVYSREQLLENVWGYSYLGDPRTVDTHIKRLREKLGPDSGPRCIKTIWSKGYKFEVTK